MPIIKMPEGHIHYAKEVDENGKFIKWLPHPDGGYKEQCRRILEAAEEKSFDSYVGWCRKQFDKEGKLYPKSLKKLQELIEEEKEFTEKDKDFCEKILSRW